LCFISLVFFPFGDTGATSPVVLFLFLGAAVPFQSSSSLESVGTFPYSFINQRKGNKDKQTRKRKTTN
jgi:hypothetical protein